MTDPFHIHPRSKRTAKSPYKPLFKPLVPVKAGASKARKAETYRGARRNAAREVAKWRTHKFIRKDLGMTRREYDRLRASTNRDNEPAPMVAVA